MCNRKCVIFQTKRARCALSKEVFDLLNEESVSEYAVVEVTYKFNEKSNSFKFISNLAQDKWLAW